jgi:hypothetical protein
MQRSSKLLAMILLITMLLSVTAPAIKVTAASNSTASNMQKTPDVFGGKVKVWNFQP